jgi:hypothetical protein
MPKVNRKPWSLYDVKELRSTYSQKGEARQDPNCVHNNDDKDDDDDDDDDDYDDNGDGGGGSELPALWVTELEYPSPVYSNSKTHIIFNIKFNINFIWMSCLKCRFSK